LAGSAVQPDAAFDERHREHPRFVANNAARTVRFVMTVRFAIVSKSDDIIALERHERDAGNPGGVDSR
jgi:hypothetical protein